MENGTYRQYESFNFQPAKIKLIEAINGIIEDYQARGYSLTLRQIYYQFVARGIVPNKLSEYNRIKDALSQGRLAGLVSWSAIEDRTRNLMGHRTYAHPNEAMSSVLASYKRDLWADQEWRPEVWVEKEALAGVVGQICSKLRVDFFACKGYNSQSEQWRAGQRFANYISKGQRPLVLHLGDHDPSGIDMTRDNLERLTMFAGTPIMVQRIALNMDQIEELTPPPNPAKSTDARFESYRAEFGDVSWELDALDPDYISKLIERNVSVIRDEDVWDQSLLREEEDKEMIEHAMENLE
jgi:hypothetical protein